MTNLDSITNLRVYLVILRKHLALIILGVILSTGIGVMATAYSKRVYESYETLLITDRKNTPETNYESYQGLLMSERLASTYSNIISSRAIADDVAKKIGKNSLDSIVASPLRDTNLIKVTANSSSPGRARKLLQATTKAFISKLSEVEPEQALSQGSVAGVKAVNVPKVKVSVIDPPALLASPVKPKPALNIVLAFLLGIFGSAGLILVVNHFDVTIRNDEELEGLLSLPVIGAIPFAKQKKKKNNPSTEFLYGLSSTAKEALLSLRTNLAYVNYNRDLKTIAVTSPKEGEGKTTVSLNLALTLAKGGNRVILIGCDLRQPSLQAYLPNTSDRGLSNVLAGQQALEKVLMPAGKRLRVLPSGPIPPNPVDLLGSQRMKEVVERAENMADFVILDCPPVLPVTDAAVLAPLVDGFLLVVKAGKTSREMILKARDALEKTSTRVLGTVLNAVDIKHGSTYSKYGYGEYGSPKKPKDRQRQKPSNVCALDA